MLICKNCKTEYLVGGYKYCGDCRYAWKRGEINLQPHKKVYKYKPSDPPQLLDRKPIIKSYRRQGYKYIEIAKIMGLSRQRVEQLLRPHKQRARFNVAKALESGRISRRSCEYPECKTNKAEAHHQDYSKPLEVIWLCKKHHSEIHTSPTLKPKKIRKCLYCGVEVSNYFQYCSKCKPRRNYKLARIIYKNSEARRASVKRSTDKWKKNNPDKVKVTQARAAKKYYEKNKELLRTKQRENYKKNAEKYRAYFRERYARKKLSKIT